MGDDAQHGIQVALENVDIRGRAAVRNPAGDKKKFSLPMESAYS